MKESRFIRQNAAKWQELEDILDQKTHDPERLSELFVEVTDDLSYAKTYYPHRIVRGYLNNVSQRLYQSIYKKKRQNLENFKHFWQYDLPLSVWHARKTFLLAFCIFLTGLGIGIISCLNDPEFANQILGEEYVSMTMDNIASGDPMAVYKKTEHSNMFLYIVWNNLQVSFRVFFSGILFGVGTLLYLMHNAIMVGTFQFFFFDKGVFLDSFITIWQHGTIEISCLIIASAAGLTLAKGIFFPGTYPRLYAMQISSLKGIRIMAGIAPLIILAGFIESFVTRLTEAPLIIRIGVLIISLLMITGYFIIYPYRVAKAAGFPEETEPSVKVRKAKINPVSIDSIFTPGTITIQALTIFRQYAGKIITAAWITGALSAFLLVYILGNTHYFKYFVIASGQESLASAFSTLTFFSEFYSVFNGTKNYVEVLLLAVLTFAALYHALRSLTRQAGLTFSYSINTFIILAVEAFVLSSVFLFLPSVAWIIYFFCIPLAAFINSALFIEEYSWDTGFRYYFRQVVQTFLTFLAIFVIYSCILMITSGAAIFVIMEFIRSNFVMNEETSHNFFHFFMLTISFTTFISGITLILIASQLRYFSVRETADADHLRDKIQKAFPS